jgi:hypothetical protein
MTENEPSTPKPADAAATNAGQLKGAMKAFRKKLNSMRLDKESGQIGGPLSSGKPSGITAITPPSQFPRAVWEELAKQGHLTYEGQGLYKLASEF